MKFGIIVFPGSNCDDDLYHVITQVLGRECQMVWHKETELKGFTSEDCILVPGGFSYGDYLRSGAIARFAPIMKSVVEHAKTGGKVFGICNGFQILCEAGLLPGALLRNENQKFICKNVFLSVENTKTTLTTNFTEKQVVNIPIAHAEGRYFDTEENIKKLEANNQILFRYCSSSGSLSPKYNPNGSVENIAGICNKEGNVFGMMPHPERASEAILGNEDGLIIFESLIGKILTT